jgi:hypothetical protein
VPDLTKGDECRAQRQARMISHTDKEQCWPCEDRSSTLKLLFKPNGTDIPVKLCPVSIIYRSPVMRIGAREYWRYTTAPGTLLAHTAAWIQVLTIRRWMVRIHMHLSIHQFRILTLLRLSQKPLLGIDSSYCSSCLQIGPAAVARDSYSTAPVIL